MGTTTTMTGNGAEDVFLLKNKKVEANPKLLRKAAKEYGLVGPGTATDRQSIKSAVEELRTEMGKRATTEDPLAFCEGCGEVMPNSIDPCPFCGFVAPVDAEVTHKAEVVSIVEAWDQARLDATTAKIVEAAHTASGNWHDMGSLLVDVHKAEGWKAGGFKSFRHYLSASVKCSPQFAYGVMEAARKFDRGLFLSVGPTKLIALLNAPEEAQSKLLDVAKSGGSTKQIRTAATAANKQKKAEAAAAKAGKPTPPPPEQVAASPARAAEASDNRGRPARELQNITLLTKVGGKPVKLPWRTTRTAELAEWKDGAYVEFKLSETVSLCVELVHDRKDPEKCIGMQGTFVQAGARKG